jgi:hypothetical protein
MHILGNFAEISPITNSVCLTSFGNPETRIFIRLTLESLRVRALKTELVDNSIALK